MSGEVIGLIFFAAMGLMFARGVFLAIYRLWFPPERAPWTPLIDRNRWQNATVEERSRMWLNFLWTGFLIFVLGVGLFLFVASRLP